ncbi:virus D5 protein-like [Thorsellia anophelis DSM 18579]|uniref:Virus D5 protein-like n=1 Tax=Thorsellia anophelis DSM 18579 TaxID=1123402 RepID=A0A1H9YEK8_9GAMM|nr:virus D5 protein-like [Thorsellia anophelis DSM 18579]
MIIIRHLLARFSLASEAKALLIEQQLSEEALDIKRGTDSLVDFCGYLFASMDCEGMLIGNAEIIPFNPKRYLYHAYLAFMRGNNLAKPVSLTRFGIDIKGALAEHSKEYLRKRTKAGIRTNLNLDAENANDWLPQANDN